EGLDQAEADVAGDRQRLRGGGGLAAVVGGRGVGGVGDVDGSGGGGGVVGHGGGRGGTRGEARDGAADRLADRAAAGGGHDQAGVDGVGHGHRVGGAEGARVGDVEGEGVVAVTGRDRRGQEGLDQAEADVAGDGRRRGRAVVAGNRIGGRAERGGRVVDR